MRCCACTPPAEARGPPTRGPPTAPKETRRGRGAEAISALGSALAPPAIRPSSRLACTGEGEDEGEGEGEGEGERMEVRGWR